MARNVGRYGPAHPCAGRLVEWLSRPAVRTVGRALSFHDSGSPYAASKGREMHERLERGEPVYLLGLGPSGHNSSAALVEVSARDGIRPLCNNEEERYTAVRHDDSFPANALEGALDCLRQRGVKPAEVLAVVASWDYLRALSTSLRLAVEEAPVGLLLMRRAASPRMNVWHCLEALAAPVRLQRFLGSTRRVPVIGMRHHDNHACFPYAVSPFASSPEPTMITVIDGFGDDGAVSLYLGTRGRTELIWANPNLFDSLGMLYGIISSTQGGWTVLASEGRCMGAAAWGDSDRLTNPYYKRLRQILYFAAEGQVSVNRSFINYHRRGQEKPYGRRLVDILGEPIPQEMMWNPDAVLRIDDAEQLALPRERLDKVAALQLVFEDALVHIVDSLIRRTGSHRLVLSGGTALNCQANMHLLESFDEGYYLRNLAQANTRLHLWVPPNPSDTGTAMGAAYQFALMHGAAPGPPMRHAFLCGRAATVAEIEVAVADAGATGSVMLGNVRDPRDCARIADAVANVIAHDGVLGLFQGCGETGPRGLGHRTILANAANPRTPGMMNAHVKYRERFRPLAPMVTLEEAKRLYHLSAGASDDDYNAYNYMVLTVRARPKGHALVPAVIHKDGTSRIQIVREETDPLSYAILKALGRRLGVEVAVNTSLNVGTPIVQTPAQAIRALHNSRGMSGLLLVADTGDAYLAWHHIEKPPKDAGRTLMRWVSVPQAHSGSVVVPA